MLAEAFAVKSGGLHRHHRAMMLKDWPKVCRQGDLRDCGALAAKSIGDLVHHAKNSRNGSIIKQAANPSQVWWCPTLFKSGQIVGNRPVRASRVSGIGAGHYLKQDRQVANAVRHRSRMIHGRRQWNDSVATDAAESRFAAGHTTVGGRPGD